MSRQACITQVSQSAALKALDPNKCRTISNEMDRSSCEHTIAMKLATENGDISACEKLDPMTRSGCEQKAMIAQNIKNGNTNSCNTLDPMMK
jgi:hypothetical protein